MKFLKFILNCTWKHSFDRKYESYKTSSFLVKCSPDLLNDFDDILTYSYERSKVIRAFMQMIILSKTDPESFLKSLIDFIEN